jgi:Reverse transcriptase (RNA-dependent DNA polymerase)
MSLNKLKVLRKYLDNNLTKEFIYFSSFPAAAPIFFIRKPGRDFRLYINYRNFNAITIKNRYSLPLVKETFNLICGTVIFIKINVVAAFHNLRMKLDEEYKTAFRLRFDFYEFLVMLFGLANAPSSFQTFIKKMLKEFLNKFCTAYMDNIFIFSRSRGKHRRYVKAVLQALSETRLYLDIEKCEFNVTKIAYLEIIVITDNIRINSKKVQTILDWENPLYTRDVQSFIRFANFYRRFY